MKHSLTVLHIFSGDLWAGAEVMIYHLLASLHTEKKLKVIALSLNNGILTDKLKSIGIEIYTIPESGNSFSKIFLKALFLLRNKNIDIIHSHRYKENFLAFLLAKFMKVNRVITTLHGLSEQFGLKTKLEYFVLKHCFTRVVAVSQEMREILVQQYRFNEKQVDTIHNGIPLSLNVSSPSFLHCKYFRIGAIGRMVPVKDFNLFLEIAAALKQQTDKVRFSILGDGPLKKELIRKTKALNLEDSVTFLSPNPDPFPFYLSIDLLLNTSLHEGIPMSILEAMACRKPVVAPRVGGIPEIISHGDDGLLVTERKPEKFVQTCLELMLNKDLRITIGNAALKKVSSCFSISRMTSFYLELYTHLPS